jgi:hypothetical protein
MKIDKSVYNIVYSIILIFLSISIVSADDGNYHNQGVLWIYSIILPVVAAILNIVAYYLNENIVPSMLSGVAWFASCFTTSNIIFINDFTVSMSPSYTPLSNPEFNYVFIGLGVIMVFHGVIIALKYAANNVNNNPEKDYA